MEIKLINEDCLVAMECIESELVDLIVTSPPYDSLRDYCGYKFSFEPIARQLLRVLKKGGVLVWITSDQTLNGSESASSLKQAIFFRELGFNLHDTMIWRKLKYVPLTHNRYEQAFEYMFVFSKGKPKTFNPIKIPCSSAGTTRNASVYRKKGKGDGDELSMVKPYTIKNEKIKSNVWDVLPQTKGVGHPAVFPLSLAEDHIKSWSNIGDIVLDPFMGSGTTGIAAGVLQRKFIGIEIAKEYFDMATERISK